MAKKSNGVVRVSWGGLFQKSAKTVHSSWICSASGAGAGPTPSASYAHNPAPTSTFFLPRLFAAAL